MRDFRGRSIASVHGDRRASASAAPLPGDVAARYYAEVEAVFARELEPVPGVVAALDRIALPSCVASSGPHHKMAVTLRTTGLWERFEGRIFSATEVANGKPAPDLFLHAARADGLRPGDARRSSRTACRASQAAVAAGMRALAFARHPTPPSSRRRAASRSTTWPSCRRCWGMTSGPDRAQRRRVGRRPGRLLPRLHAPRGERRLGVTGWVRNRPDGRVEALFEGPPDAVAAARAVVPRGPAPRDRRRRAGRRSRARGPRALRDPLTRCSC